MILPEDFVTQKFYQFVGAPSKNRYNRTYQGSCPICREGNSWLKKRRFYYIPSKNRLYCHNCGYNKSTIDWIKEMTGMSFLEIKEELNTVNIDILPVEEVKPSRKVETLPKDSINLFDPIQIEYYKSNKFVKIALDFLNNRKLLNANNKPKAYFISLTDFVHKNRIIIPFYDQKNKITHYQTRILIDSDDRPRYMSKIGSEKTIFNINNIDSDFDKIFIFEGPFNSTFTKNGVAIAGIQEGSYQLFTSAQESQIMQFPLHERIWVLDSQHIDNAARNKSIKLLELGENVFIWPKKLGIKFKDFNDIAVGMNINKIPPEFILKYTFKGDEGLSKL